MKKGNLDVSKFPISVLVVVFFCDFRYLHDALLSLLHYLDAEGCIGENDVLLGWEGTVFKYCIKDVLSLFLGCSASHLFRFGYLETETLRLEDLLHCPAGGLPEARLFLPLRHQKIRGSPRSRAFSTKPVGQPKPTFLLRSNVHPLGSVRCCPPLLLFVS